MKRNEGVDALGRSTRGRMEGKGEDGKRKSMERWAQEVNGQEEREEGGCSDGVCRWIEVEWRASRRRWSGM